MAHRTFKIATVISAAMLSVSVLLFLVGYITSPWDYHFSFSDDSHVGVWGRGLDSRLVFFNNAEYGPYRGSIIGLVDADGSIYPPLEREESFGDSWGIYYRHFQCSDSTLWTLMVTLWYPIAFFAIMPLASLVCSAAGRNASTVAEQSGEREPPIARILKS
ncbi:hypothetical protein Q31b_50270 [Novipirellula aureliae]|uniref:Uncharacterized protein n=1 Tax=Novipirellula aureliae TaxID=2527966 RepID=A0A5C6DKJ9_9BACT|nr:hypothetical protein [Novipirellula aureliae]TWU36745.1 hypothetical protein Q31b_50270 [Novipirellula aureliae]